jgi:hypothetical protein
LLMQCIRYMEAAMDFNTRQSDAVLDERAAWSEIKGLSASAPREQRVAKMKSWSLAKQRCYRARMRLLNS